MEHPLKNRGHSLEVLPNLHPTEVDKLNEHAKRTEARFVADPCKYFRNIAPWPPQPIKVFIPADGHYDGLGKPPVRQFFKITEMRVGETRTIPAYEILTKDNVCEYYKHSV